MPGNALILLSEHYPMPTITIRPKDFLVSPYYQAHMALVEDDLEATGNRAAVIREIRQIEKKARAMRCDILTETVVQVEIDSEINQLPSEHGQAYSGDP